MAAESRRSCVAPTACETTLLMSAKLAPDIPIATMPNERIKRFFIENVVLKFLFIVLRKAIAKTPYC